MLDDLTEEQKEMIKKSIEGFKEKIYWELQNNETNVLIFGNDRISSTTGDMRLVMFKLACMIDQMSMQSGKNRKDILRGIREMFKMVDYAKKENQKD